MQFCGIRQFIPETEVTLATRGWAANTFASDVAHSAWALPSLWTRRRAHKRLGKPHRARFPTASTRIIVIVKKWLRISGGSFTSLI